jgi:four helix bundle protein
MERKQRFRFEELNVWTKAVEFSVQIITLVEKIETPQHSSRLLEQAVVSATSVAMHIADGKGSFSKKEFRQGLIDARGALHKTVTLLVIMHRVGWISDADYETLEGQAVDIGSLIKGLINSLG